MNGVHISAIDANLLVTLDALLTERNVTRAAVRLGLSQSAVSHKLRRLREIFDDELLVPARSGMLTTPRADALAPTLERAVRSLQAVLEKPSEFDPRTVRRAVRVLSSDYAELVVAPYVVEAFAQAAPGVDTVLLSPLDPADQLERGQADWCIGSAFEGAGLRRRALFEEQLVCGVRRDHPEVGPGDAIDLETFTRVGHVVCVHAYNEGPDPIDEVLTQQGLQRRRVVTTPHLVGGPLVAARTDLLIVGPRGVLQAAAHWLPLRVLALPFALPSVPVVMTWHERFHDDPAHRWLRDFCAEKTMEVAASHGLVTTLHR